MIDHVLIVCEGNICRSPLACALLAMNLPEIRFSSAGMQALIGEKADPLVVEMARERGVALEGHVATALTYERVSAADLVLTMTSEQRERIELSWPSTRGKVHRFAGNDGMDVVDPYGRHRTTFELAFAQIELGVAHWRRVLAGPTH